MYFAHFFLALPLLLMGSPLFSQQELFQKRHYQTPINSVRSAFDALGAQGEKVVLKGEPWIANMVEAHVQGVAMYGDYCLLTHNNRGYSKGVLLVMNMKSGKMVHKIKTPDEGYNHPGGIQVIGDFLLVPLEDSHHTKSIIRLYDLANMTDTTQPILLPLTIERPEIAAGGVGIADFTDGMEQYYLLCAYDNGRTDFYQSNGGLLIGPSTSFEKIFDVTLPQTGYSSVCLLAQADNRVFLIGFRIVRKGFKCDDFADLYEVDIQKKSVSLIAERQFESNNAAIKGTAGVHFRWGGGLRVVSASKIEFLATQRNFVGGRLPINWFR